MKAGWQKHGMGAEVECFTGRHGRVDAILPGFIATGGHHTPAVGLPAHNDWFALKLRIVPLLNGSIKSIHVNMDNLSDGFTIHTDYHPIWLNNLFAPEVF